jgi:hypothetical protein
MPAAHIQVALALITGLAAAPLAHVALNREDTLHQIDDALQRLGVAEDEPAAAALIAEIKAVQEIVRPLSHAASAEHRRLSALALRQSRDGVYDHAVEHGELCYRYRSAVLRHLDCALGYTALALQRENEVYQGAELRKAGGHLAETLFYALLAGD